jgi:hypothetical protein
MKVSGEIYAPAALCPGKDTSPPSSLQIEYELVGTLWGREHFLDPTGNGTMIISA